MNWIKILLNRLTFLVYEFNLRIVGRFNNKSKSQVNNHLKSYYLRNAIGQTAGIVSVNLFIIAKTLGKLLKIETNTDVSLVSSIVVGFFIVWCFVSRNDFFKKFYMKQESEIIKRSIIRYNLAVIIIFFILPIGLLVLYSN